MEHLRLKINVYSGNSAYINRLNTLLEEGWQIDKFYPFDYMEVGKGDSKNPRYIFELVRDDFNKDMVIPT